MPQRPAPKRGFRRERTRRSERSTAGRKPMFDELAALDTKIVALIKERSAHLAKIRSKGGMDSVDEKSIWSIWQRALPKTRGGASIWRKLFFLLQDLEPEPEEDNRASDGFLLAPRRGPYVLKLDPPRTLAGMQCLAALGACEEFSIAPAVVNERLVQTVKAFNQTGAGLYWESDQLSGRGAEELSYRDKSVFVGDDSLAFHLILARCLAEPGSVKFTGGHLLKTADLTMLARLLPRLGGRLVNIIPGSKGLPVRVEASGQLPDEVLIPEELPSEAVLGLLMAAPFYPEGLTLRSENPSPALRATLDFAASILTACSINVDVRNSGDGYAIGVKPGTPVIPKSLPVDAGLGAFLLAMPRLDPSGESTVTLEGSWPEETGAYATALEMLRAAGVVVESDASSLRSCTGQLPPEAPRLECAGVAELFPLSFALAASMPASIIDKPDSNEDLFTCRELADSLGLRIEEGDGVLRIENIGRQDDSYVEPWVAPNAWWAVAYAAMSFRRPGLVLADPSAATDLLPRFWNFYNTLPSPQSGVFYMPKREAGNETNEPERKGRRIRIPNS